MPIDEILKVLIAEREKLDAAIRALKGESRKGTVPSPKSRNTATKVKRTVSIVARAKMSEAAKVRWAKHTRVVRKAAKEVAFKASGKRADKLPPPRPKDRPVQKVQY
jgi:hypothetical protein